MKFKPLTGQVLVEILPEQRMSAGGIALPESQPMSPENVQQSHRDPPMPKPWIGRVVSVGNWPKTKSGLLRMPEYGRNARVVISRNAGQEMAKGSNLHYRMVPQEDVLAVFC